MKKGLVMVLVVALLAVASTASAQVFAKGKVNFSLGLTQFVAHSVDTLGFGISAFDHNVLGFRGDFMYNFTDNWAFDLGGFFGFGSASLEDTSGEYKDKVSAFGVRGGVDYTFNIGDMVGGYMGPGIEFASARNSFEAPGFDEDNPRVTTLSLEGRVGVMTKLGPNFGLNANLGQKWSYSSKTFDFAGVENKVKQWVSSMNGFAGFVIFFN